MKVKYIIGVTYTCLAAASINVNAALVDGSVINFTAYTGGSTIPANGNGSWFGVETSTLGIIGISSLDGLVVGSTQTATGSHAGAPDGTESAAIDTPHNWYDNTGMLSTVSDTNILSTTANTAVLDFSGVRWSWGGTDILLFVILQ